MLYAIKLYNKDIEPISSTLHIISGFDKESSVCDKLNKKHADRNSNNNTMYLFDDYKGRVRD